MLSLSQPAFFFPMTYEQMASLNPKFLSFLRLIQPHSTICKSFFLINFKHFAMEE